MDEETQNDSIDIYERRTYHIVISGENVMMPIDRFIELTVYLAENFIEANRADEQTVDQQVKINELLGYLNEQFPGVADGEFTSSDITLEPVRDDDNGVQ
jgi:hypothetical protein